MTGTGGFFLKGLAGGLQGLGTQVAEMTWQKREKERIQKEKDALMETMTVTTKKFDSFYQNYNVDEDEKLQAQTIWLALSQEAQGLLKGTYDAVMNTNKDVEEQNLATLKAYREDWEGVNFDLSTIPEIYEYYKGRIKGEKGKAMFVAGDSLLKKKHELLQGQQPEGYNSPDELLKAHPGADWEFNASIKKYIQKSPEATKPKEAGISDYNSAASYLKNYANSKMPDTDFYKIRDGMATKFGLDLSGMTRDSLKEIIKPETESAFEERIRIAEEGGATPEELYNMKIGRSNTSKTGTTTAGGVTAQDFLFGDKVGAGNIFAGMDLNALTEENKTAIRSYYNRNKSFIKPDELPQVEGYLQQLGVDLNAPAITEDIVDTGDVVTDKQPNKFQTYIQGEWGKAKDFVKNIGKKKDYTAMSDDELADLGQPPNSDPLAIQELKRRNLL